MYRNVRNVADPDGSAVLDKHNLRMLEYLDGLFGIPQ
jgi:hypothetical protein